jgi:DNA-binding GntR family transcriptional regulator
MTAIDALAGGPGAKLSTPDWIAEQLRRAILTGAIEGGVQLKQNDVAARFGVSVAPVREALQRLIADGLAVLHPNRGVTVSMISALDFREIAELRVLLEPHALRLSAPRLTRGDFEYSETLLVNAAKAADPLQRASLHWEFHRSLYHRADRPRLLAQIAGLYQSINRYLLPAWASSGLSANWIESHLTIVTAIRNNDLDQACRLIVEQTLESSDRVRAQLWPARGETNEDDR